MRIESLSGRRRAVLPFERTLSGVGPVIVADHALAWQKIRVRSDGTATTITVGSLFGMNAERHAPVAFVEE